MTVRRPAAALVSIIAAAVVLGALVPSNASTPPPARPSSTLAAAAQAELAYYQDQLPPGIDVNCLAPAGNPAVGTPAWELRDVENQYCATLRLRDQVDNPAFAAAFDPQLPGLYADQLLAQLGQPGHLRGGLTTLVPGADVADPFRTLSRWTGAGRGRVKPVAFAALDGAVLRGYVFEPPARNPPPPGGYPGVVITDGSVQGYQQLYFWAAEGLAEAGYMVMTYDVQGQGSSDLLPANCVPSAAELASGSVCTGVPFQQAYNFFQGAEDSLSFFLSTATKRFGGSYNPAFAALDRSKIALAGHSFGAAAVSEVGQCDARVKAIVAWDNLSAITGCNGEHIAPSNRSKTLLHAPALGLTNDYLFNPQPMTAVPAPHAKDDGYRQLAAAGINSMEVTLRGATHLTYSYIPYVLPSSQLAERMAFYYTLAWLDYHLRARPVAFSRLLATSFDGSADVHSIGAGTYSLSRALSHPGDPTAGNVPYAIAGLPVANITSFYYESEYSVRDQLTGVRHRCLDMRAGCPAVAPATP
jgi:alpha-beta hydrolase superfamily lysophospholipase